MIVIYDNTGRITQTFLHVAPSLEEYAATVLDPAGAQYLFWEGDGIETKYVFNGEVVERPIINVGSNVLSHQLTVNQLITLTIDQTALVRVITNGQIVASETVNDGLVELSFDHPGKYIVEIGGDFPIIETREIYEVA